MISADKLKKIQCIAAKTVSFCGLNLLSAEYILEGGHNFLRIKIDREGGVSTADCESVSRAVSKKLDEIDLIKEQYFLEVSSPGTDEYKGVPELG